MKVSERNTLELRTDRLLLRPITESDIQNYQKYFNNYAVVRYLNAVVPWPYPDEGAQQFYFEVIVPNQGKDRWFWAITRTGYEGELIGTIDLVRQGSPENRGFWLAEPFWGTGYMTEAVSAVNRFAFDELGFSRLIFAHAKGNIGSRRVKEKTSAVFLRTEPAKFVDREFTERELWELTKEAWKTHSTETGSLKSGN